jgi:exonuclease SbcC
MIERLTIKNFQSHENTVVDFDKGINVIVGSSDSGKSAVLRALRWVVYNQPSGDGFRSNWGGDTSCAVHCGGHVVKRTKTDRKNSYEVNDLELTAFGRNVPEEVREILNFNDINMQQQLDAPFLLSQSAGDVARYFNSITDLESMDESIKLANRFVLRIANKLDGLKMNLQETEKRLLDYKSINLIKAGLELAQQQQKEMEEIAEKIDKIQSMIKHIVFLRASISKLSVDSVVIKYGRLEKKVEDYQEEERKFLQVSSTTEKVKQTKAALKKFVGLKSLQVENENLQEVFEKVKGLEKEIGQIKGIKTNIERAALQLEELSLSLSELQSEWDENMSRACPLCGRTDE